MMECLPSVWDLHLIPLHHKVKTQAGLQVGRGLLRELESSLHYNSKTPSQETNTKTKQYLKVPLKFLATEFHGVNS